MVASLSADLLESALDVMKVRRKKIVDLLHGAQMHVQEHLIQPVFLPILYY